MSSPVVTKKRKCDDVAMGNDDDQQDHRQDGDNHDHDHVDDYRAAVEAAAASISSIINNNSAVVVDPNKFLIDVAVASFSSSISRKTHHHSDDVVALDPRRLAATLSPSSSSSGSEDNNETSSSSSAATTTGGGEETTIVEFAAHDSSKSKNEEKEADDDDDDDDRRRRKEEFVLNLTEALTTKRSTAYSFLLSTAELSRRKIATKVGENDDCLSHILQFMDVLDLHQMKRVSKGFGELCITAIKNKCPKSKPFKDRDELEKEIDMFCNIKYGIYTVRFLSCGLRFEYSRVEYKGGESQRRKDAELLARRRGWIMNNWNTSNVTYYDGLFHCNRFDPKSSNKRFFNEKISNWDVSKATTMKEMFWNAHSFNQDISSWNDKLHNVTTMKGMFQNAYSFNKDISSWNVSNETNTDGMFLGATSFNARQFRQLPWRRPAMLDFYW